MKASTLRDWDLTGAADVDMLRDGREVRCPDGAPPGLFYDGR